MLPIIADLLNNLGVPLFSGVTRLLSSYIVLIGLGTGIGFITALFLLPRFWHRLPQDQGKAIAQNMTSKGKPTSAGILLFIFAVISIVLIYPFTWQSWYIIALVICIGLMMIVGYLDDKSAIPWSENKKLALDILICFAAAWLLSCRPTMDPETNEWVFHILPQKATIWFPFLKQMANVGIIDLFPSWLCALKEADCLLISPLLYLPLATFILLIAVNITNCSDGIDSLAGMLALLTLVYLAIFLYLATGHTEYSEYLRIPHHAGAPRWALIIFCFTGVLCGYLWHNAPPSAVLMGDSGSRAIGLLIGISVLLTGNPLFILAVAPMIVINGGGGLIKIIALRTCNLLGMDTKPPHVVKKLQEENPDYKLKQHGLIKMLHIIRFPLHDHFKINKGWGPAQIMIRFLIIQALLIPVLIIIFVKLR